MAADLREVGERLVRALATLAPVRPAPEPALDRALTVLDAGVESDTVVAAAHGALLLATGSALVVAAWGAVVPAAVLVALGALVAWGIRALPGWLATARRIRALGAAPDLVGLAVLRARVEPTLESAAAFAAAHGRGPLSASLDEHVRQARGTADAGLSGFAATWRGDAGLHRAVSLLSAAVETGPADRERLLDRALETVLDGTRERMARFASSVRGPTSALYAFGVVLPLALVATLPAARAAGVPVSVPLVVAVYDLLLPGALLAAGAWILGRRPTAFPPAPVGRDHPDVPDRRLVTATCAIGAGAVGWAGCSLWLVPWTRWIAAPAATIGTALVLRYRPVMAVREHVRTVEASFPDALTVVGERLQRGQSLEAAIAEASDVLPSPVDAVFEDAARVQRQLGVDPGDAFLGPHGALAAVPSPRVRASAALLALAAREGEHGGRILLDMADHVESLVAVERSARRDVGAIVGTLRSTACCFAPVIGGVTVALASRLDGSGLEAGLPPVPADALGMAVGAYVVTLAVVLAVLAAALDRGLDRTLAGYHAGVACLSAGCLYPLIVTLAGVLVQF